MRRVRPWVKKALLASVIVVAAGAAFSFVAGERGRDVSRVVKVSQEFHGRPAGDMKISIKPGTDAAVPAPDLPAVPALRDGDGPIRIQGGEGGMRLELPHREHGARTGVAIGFVILIAGLLFLLLKRGKRTRIADGPSTLAGIPSASDFLDQWEVQQNQTKESN